MCGFELVGTPLYNSTVCQWLDEARGGSSQGPCTMPGGATLGSLRRKARGGLLMGTVVAHPCEVRTSSLF